MALREPLAGQVIDDGFIVERFAQSRAVGERMPAGTAWSPGRNQLEGTTP